MQKIFQRIINYLLEQYAAVLVILALVSVATYLVLITDIRDQEGNALLVKMSSEQGRLVQDINLSLTQKTYLVDPEAIRKIDSKVVTDIIQLEESHASLRDGVRFIREGQRLVHVPGQLSPELRLLFFDGAKPLDSLMRDYTTLARKLQRIPAGQADLAGDDFNRLLFQITPLLVDELSRVAMIHQRQSEFMLSATINKQHMSFAIALASLVMVGFLLLHPLVSSLKEKAFIMKQEADNVINTTHSLIVGLDQEADVVLFNQHAQDDTGWHEEEIKGSNFFERCIPEEDQPGFRKLFNDMMSGLVQFGEELETRMRISSGELIDVAWNSTVLKNIGTKKPVMFLATGLDITARKSAERKVQQANAELAELGLRLQSEINLAATLQKSILPDPQISLPGLQGQASLLTSSEVGGDYYDYYNIGGTHSIVMIGDVSGHGVAAGTLVSAAKAGVYPLVVNEVISPNEILSSLNKTIRATAQQSLLMTMACISLDARTGKLVFANAGHVLPFLLRNQSHEWVMLEASGLPLGKSIDADYFADSAELTLNVGDKLFLYTDGLLEEESPNGEVFGYDRLEYVLNNNLEASPEQLRDKVLEALRLHCRGKAYNDDVTITVLVHSDRVIQANPTSSEVSDIIRISENFYRQGEHPIPRISREYVVFLAEEGYADLLSRFSQDGICRILPRYNDVCQKLGWEHLLNQHHESPDDDLYTLMPKNSEYRQFHLTHTEDKLFIMEEIQSWLSDQGRIAQDQLDALMVILDEMSENSLYAAPRDGKGVPYYTKGESRELSTHEEVRIDVALSEDFLGLMITDNWGTLTPATFLRSIARSMEEGVEAGIGGVGLYMMWRLSDYLQIRVHPQKRTQVTTLWELNQNVDMDVDSGLQFLFHTEYETAVA